MKISHNWLQTYFQKSIPSPLELENFFALHSFEVEEIANVTLVEKSSDGIEHIIKDFCLNVKILPDRAHYALCHRGIADEISVITKESVKERWFLKNKPKVSNPTILSARIEDIKFCRRYTGQYLEIKRVEPSFLWMKTSLEAIGQRAINSIVDITNYIMFDIGQPLHAFDASKIKGQIVIRAAKDGEKITLLDDREISLTSEDHVIADDEGPLDIAGVKGGKRAEISSTTIKILLTSCNFDPVMVRRTSTRYNLRNEASKRFENEITPELAREALDHLSALTAELYPEAIFGPITDVYHNKPKQTIIEFDPSYLEERLGVKVPLAEARDILERMDIKISVQDSASQTIWFLAIPYKRLDLVIKEDIVEEIGRVYGYDHIEGILPLKLSKAPVLNPSFYLSEKIKNILVEKGFSEVSLYTLVEKGEIEILKPLAKDKAFARPDLSLGMVACLERNALNADLLGYEVIKIFEIGHIFKKDSEEIHLAIGVRQTKKVKGLKSENLVKEVLDALGDELSVNLNSDSGLSLRQAFSKTKIDENGIAEVNLSQLIEIFKAGANLKELTLEDLAFKPASNNRYKKFSTYPFIVRDVAVFVPESLESKQVWSVIEKSLEKIQSKDLLVRSALFDTFKKGDRVSYAFRLVLQSMERTMTDDEANKIMETIHNGLKKEGWEVR